MESEKKILYPGPLRYSEKQVNPPDHAYTYQKVQVYSGQSGTFDLSQAELTSVLQLPNEVVNLSQSKIVYRSTYSASATNYNWAIMDCVPEIKNIRFTSKFNTEVANIQNADVYQNIVNRPETRMNDLQNRGVIFDPTFVYGGSVQDLSPLDSKYQNYTLFSTSTLTGIGSFFDSTGSFSADANSFVPQDHVGNYYMRQNGSKYSTALEPLNVINGSLNGDDPIVNREVYLGSYKNSILSLNKDILFNELMLLEITWNTRDKLGFISKSVNDPTVTPAVLPDDVQISDMYLLLAVNKDPILKQQLRNQINSETGFIINIPYVIQTNQTSNASTEQSMTVQVDRNNGNRLLKVYHTLYNTTQSANTLHDHANNDNNGDGGQKVTSLRSYLDDNPLQPFEVNCDSGKFVDWYLQSQNCKESTVNNQNAYAFKWFWCDNFTSFPLCYDIQDLDVGLSLENDYKWRIDLTTANSGFIHYNYLIVKRKLRISNIGVEFLIDPEDKIRMKKIAERNMDPLALMKENLVST